MPDPEDSLDSIVEGEAQDDEVLVEGEDEFHETIQGGEEVDLNGGGEFYFDPTKDEVGFDLNEDIGASTFDSLKEIE